MEESDLADILHRLGLNDKEARMYLACLELGSSSVQAIAEKSGVKRTSIYNFLEDMKLRGFISEVRYGKRILLVPEEPHMLLKKYEEQYTQLEKALPQFMSIYNRPGEKPKVFFYQGLDGVKRVYEDTLTVGESIYLVSDFERMFAAIDEDWMWDYARRRSQKNIKAYSIAKEGAKAVEVRKKDAEQLRETRFVQEVNFETEINIYEDKVAIISFRRPYSGVIIQDIAIAQTLRSMWQIIWGQAK